MRRLGLSSAVCAAVLWAAVDVGAAGPRTVVVENIDFQPRAAKITKGATVRWSFRDGATPHNVVSRGTPRFRSSPVKTRGSYEVRFRRAGTYRYVCTLHPGMAGRVVVR
jgi:plastocyanin